MTTIVTQANISMKAAIVRKASNKNFTYKILNNTNKLYQSRILKTFENNVLLKLSISIR